MNVVEITEEEALDRFRKLKTHQVKGKDLAARFGVSPAFVSCVMLGKKRMTPAMLDAVNVERVTIYRATDPDNQ